MLHSKIFKIALLCFSGVVVGTGMPKKSNESIKHVLKYKDTLTGVALAGITDAGEESDNLAIQKLDDILKKVGVSI